MVRLVVLDAGRVGRARVLRRLLRLWWFGLWPVRPVGLARRAGSRRRRRPIGRISRGRDIVGVPGTRDRRGGAVSRLARCGPIRAIGLAGGIDRRRLGGRRRPRRRGLGPEDDRDDGRGRGRRGDRGRRGRFARRRRNLARLWWAGRARCRRRLRVRRRRDRSLRRSGRRRWRRRPVARGRRGLARARRGNLRDRRRGRETADPDAQGDRGQHEVDHPEGEHESKPLRSRHRRSEPPLSRAPGTTSASRDGTTGHPRTEPRASA